MKPVEYILSVLVAVAVLAALGIWTQVAHSASATAISCRPGQAAAPVFLKGMSLYRCPVDKRG